MSPADPLEKTLRRVRRRVLVVRAAEAGLAGALVGAAVGLGMTVLRIVAPRVLPADWTHPAWPLACLPAGFALAFLVRLAAGVSLRQAAIAADRAGQLKERLATALEVLSVPSPSGHPGTGTARAVAGGTPAVPGARPGDLDEALLDQARTEALRLEVSHLVLARSLGRRGRMTLAAAVVLAGLALVPSLAGPPIAAPSASHAAKTLLAAGRNEHLAPDLRRAVEGAVARLLEPGARERDAREATGEIEHAALEGTHRRNVARAAIERTADPALRKMAAAAGRGDAAGAATAADELAERLSSPPGAGGMPNVERERLADAIEGAAGAAQETDLARLAEELRAAANAIRGTDAGTSQALQRLAEAMTDALGAEPAEAAGAVLAAVRQARRTLGLPETPAGPAGAPVADTSGSAPGAAGPPPSAAASAGPDEGPSGTGPAHPVGPEVRPEDRDAVRRYFGG